MANTVYPLYKQAIMGAGGPNLTGGAVKAALVSAGYTPNYASDQWWSAANASVVGTPTVIGSPTVTGGIFNGAGVTFNAVSGAQVTQIVIFNDTSTPGTSALIANIVSPGGATGLPVTPNGGNITITWDSGPNKIFAL